MKIEVSRYLKSDGYPSRYWAVLIDGDLLAVTLYRKGAEAVASALTKPKQGPHVPTLEKSAKPSAGPDNASPGMASDRTR